MKGARYRQYLLGVLITVLAFNSVDRLALGLVMQDIKLDLQVSDTQLGLLTGIAFALFYSVMGIPIARWADQGNRVTIISLTTALWSAAVALSGAAASFLQLMMIRVVVAVGEAGCIPTAHSLIADHFTRAERPRAVARYMLGIPLSSVIGFFLAGWLNELYGWRVMFVVLGVPGLALAALVRFTLSEPRRLSAGGVRLQVEGAPVRDGPTARKELEERAADEPARQAELPLAEVLSCLWANVTFRQLVLFNAVVSFFGFGILQWQPTFFVRSHGLQTGELGTWFAIIVGGGSFIGTYCGGELASRRAAGNERVQLKAIGLAYASFGILSALIYLVPDVHWAFALLGLAAAGSTSASGPLYATIQTVVSPRMRAMSIAVMYLFGNLIGLGLGPLAAGALSDALRPWAGEDSLRYALIALCPGYFWGAWHLWRASRTVDRDVQAAHEAEQAASTLRPVLESLQ